MDLERPVRLLLGKRVKALKKNMIDGTLSCLGRKKHPISDNPERGG